MLSKATIKTINETYNELPQSFRVRFAWTIQTEPTVFKNQHGWIVCRDFLGDYVVGKMIDNSFNIYRFDATEGLPTNLLALDFPAPKHLEIFLKQIKYIQSLENFNNTKQTEILFANEDQSVIKVPDFWMKSNVLLSLYTFLIKIFSYTEKDPFENAPPVEGQYIMATSKVLPDMLKNLSKLKFPSFLDQWKDSHTTAEIFHNESGFVSYSKSPQLVNQLKKV